MADVDPKTNEVVAVCFMSLMVLCHYSKTNNVKKRARKNRRWWIHPILKDRQQHGYGTALLPTMLNTDPALYTNFLRMSPQLFQELLSMIAPIITKRDTRFRAAIPAETRLQITLRYLATGENFKSLQLQFRVGETTIGKIVRETCLAIWKVLSPIHLRFPQSEMDWLQIANGFEQKLQLPHCMGAIDGKHIRMENPKNSGSLNFNYKKFFSKVLFAVADSNYRFVYVDVGSYGSEGDSGILSKSEFGKLLFSGKLKEPVRSVLANSNVLFPYYFIGDQAFPLRVNFLRPYKGNTLSRSSKIFNYRICRARRVVENAFGILTNRFRVFRTELHASEETNDYVVLAAVSLHNYLIDMKSQQYCPQTFVDHELPELNYEPVNGSWRNDTTPVNGLQPQCRQGSANSTRLAIQNRDTIAKYFCTDGSVEWQDVALQNGYYS